MSEDWRENPAVMALVDAVLLGLIRSHRTMGDEGTRLRNVKMALFGIPAPRGKPVDTDLPELLLMAKEYAADRGPSEFDANYTPIWPAINEEACRSVTLLARVALSARSQSEPNEKIHNYEEKSETW
jgi:hypothetical protein